MFYKSGAIVYFWKDRNLMLSFDGKTIHSTDKMDKYEKPLHIVSVQIAELGITIWQKIVDGKRTVGTIEN